MQFEKKKILVLALIVSVFFGCSSSEYQENTKTTQTPIAVTDPDPIVWETIFEENFDGDTIDSAIWNVWEGGAFNNELQMYQGENITVENGLLIVESRREMATGVTNPFDPTPKDFEFTSGRIESVTQFSPSDPSYNGGVKFSARIKIGEGEGIWPTFWSYGNDWPTNGEIDVLEVRGGEPNKFLSNYFYGTELGVNLVSNQEKVFVHSESLANDFHIYEVEWTKNKFAVFFDGELVHFYTASNSNFVGTFYEKMQQVVFNGAIGGDFFVDLDPTAIPDSVTHSVDWIRVSKIKS